MRVQRKNTYIQTKTLQLNMTDENQTPSSYSMYCKDTPISSIFFSIVKETAQGQKIVLTAVIFFY